jgi:hypothetical protein
MNQILAIKLPNHEPLTRKSRSNYEFNLKEAIWQLDNSCSIDWSHLPANLDLEVLLGYQLVIARLAEEVSARHTLNCWYYFLNFFLRTPHYSGGKVTDVQILNLRADLSDTDEYKLGTIRVLLRNWIEWGYSGLAPGLEKLLDSLVLKGNVKGKAVLHQCPHSGPYTITEQQSLLIWAGNAFQKKLLTLKQFSWFYLVHSSARRPVQLRALRIGDLRTGRKGNSIFYEINIPRSKQRGIGFRKQMRSLTITKDLYLVLVNQAESVREAMIKLYPDMAEHHIQDLPLYLSMTSLAGISSFEEYFARQENQPDYFHMNSADANHLTQAISQLCDAISERTSDYIHFTPMRCRRTRATNLVRHGIAGVQLAYLMDHSDTQQLKVYTQYTPELALRIFKYMDGVMDSLARKFDSRIIASDKEAVRASDPSGFVYTDSGKKVGACGGSPACAVGIKACVVCDLLQPLLHAPWEDLLLELIEELEQLKQKGASELILQSYDLQIAHVLAIIEACKKKLASGGDQ